MTIAAKSLTHASTAIRLVENQFWPRLTLRTQLFELFSAIIYQVFERWPDLTRHIRQSHSPSDCPECGKVLITNILGNNLLFTFTFDLQTFTSKQSMRNHIKYVHSVDQMFLKSKCHLCRRVKIKWFCVYKSHLINNYVCILRWSSILHSILGIFITRCSLMNASSARRYSNYQGLTGYLSNSCVSI